MLNKPPKLIFFFSIFFQNYFPVGAVSDLILRKLSVCFVGLNILAVGTFQFRF